MLTFSRKPFGEELVSEWDGIANRNGTPYKGCGEAVSNGRAQSGAHAEKAWASAFMHFAYLDEFGHGGPYFGRSHPCHNHSPIFGLAGIILPETAVRPFASFFLNRKIDLLSFEISKSTKAAYEWEKKGTSLYTPKSIVKYPEIRRTTFRILNKLKEMNGRVFYCGREKWKRTEDVNPTGLYTTIFSDAIRQLDHYCEGENSNFVMVVDENSARKELLETASKTMYGANPAVRLASPPFEVESYLNQNIQAADWIAALIGRIFAYRILPQEYADLEPYEKYFGTRLQAVATHSTVMQRRTKTRATALTKTVISYERVVIKRK